MRVVDCCVEMLLYSTSFRFVFIFSATSSLSSTSALEVFASWMIIVSVCNKHQSLIGYRVQANDCCMLADIPTVDCGVLMLIVVWHLWEKILEMTSLTKSQHGVWALRLFESSCHLMVCLSERFFLKLAADSRRPSYCPCCRWPCRCCRRFWDVLSWQRSGCWRRVRRDVVWRRRRIWRACCVTCNSPTRPSWRIRWEICSVCYIAIVTSDGRSINGCNTQV